MASVFAALEDALSEACDGVFGEAFELRPMVAAPGGGRRSVDATRAVKTVTGIYESKSFKSTEFGSEARGSLPASMERTSVSIDKRQFTAGQPVRRLDQLRRAATGELFEVSQDPGDDGEGRIKLALKSLGYEP